MGKIKKVVLWFILIFAALGFAGSFIELITFASGNLLSSFFGLVIFGWIIIKLQKKLNVRSLFKRNEPKKD